MERVVNEQNPWKRDGSVPGVLAPHTQRPLAGFLSRSLLSPGGLSRYNLILGPRRVGKTTVMYQAVRDLIGSGVSADRIWWIRLDHPLLMNVPLGDLVKEVARNSSAGDEAVLFLDELAYSQNWDRWLKSFYDDRLPVKIVATSSAVSALGKKSESGVGRWTECPLEPCLLGEYMGLKGIAPDGIETLGNLRLTVEAALSRSGFVMPAEHLKQSRRTLLFAGGFPELLLSERKESEADFVIKSQRILRSDAIERAVYKDIPQSFGIDNPLLLERLLYTFAGNIAGVLSPSGIMSDLGGMSQPTFDRYLSYLERAFLVFTLPNYSGSERKVQRRGRKLYFVDCAVRNAALYRGLAALEDSGELGLLFENMAAAHLHVLGSREGVRLYHWRDGKDEVDLVYDHPESPLAFEISSSERHSREGLAKFMEKHPKFRGGCYLACPDALRVRPSDSRDGVGSIPLDMFLLCVSGQAERALAEAFKI